MGVLVEEAVLAVLELETLLIVKVAEVVEAVAVKVYLEPDPYYIWIRGTTILVST